MQRKMRPIRSEARVIFRNAPRQEEPLSEEIESALNSIIGNIQQAMENRVTRNCALTIKKSDIENSKE